ncbi:hypothetical protein [Methylobacterium sp. R2-1]|uniref:hypothetical protein n=1 Tax=Methylobacterium sp. R2-1 TaxID=2587064 RepID=UPI0017F32F3E|nr:hypothetical protein [Methylobacterium sp. R2-1]MBB2962599.1 hypothetical protein [Methylobacterium sp. R2-1]
MGTLAWGGKPRLSVNAVMDEIQKEHRPSRRTVGASAATVRRDLACLSTVFGFAIEKERANIYPSREARQQRQNVRRAKGWRQADLECTCRLPAIGGDGCYRSLTTVQAWDRIAAYCVARALAEVTRAER